MALHKLERRNYGGKLSLSIKYQNLHYFKEGLILLCQSILEMRRITHLHGSAHFTIPLNFTHCTFTYTPVISLNYIKTLEGSYITCQLFSSKVKFHPFMFQTPTTIAGMICSIKVICSSYLSGYCHHL